MIATCDVQQFVRGDREEVELAPEAAVGERGRIEKLGGRGIERKRRDARSRVDAVSLCALISVLFTQLSYPLAVIPGRFACPSAEPPRPALPT